MRRFGAVFALSLLCAVSLGVHAAPTRERGCNACEKKPRIVKLIKKAVRSLGDLLTIPTP